MPAAMRTPGAISSHSSDGVEATVEVGPRRRTHRRGDRRGAGTRVPHVDAEEGAGRLLLRRDPLGDLGLHRPDGEAPAVGEHDDPVAPVGTPGEVVARVGHAAVVEPELALLVGVAAHVGGAPNRDPPVVGRVGVGERQRHLLVGRFDVAEHDERAAVIVADHDPEDRRTQVLGPAGAVGVAWRRRDRRPTPSVSVDRIRYMRALQFRLGGNDSTCRLIATRHGGDSNRVLPRPARRAHDDGEQSPHGPWPVSRCEERSPQTCEHDGVLAVDGGHPGGRPRPRTGG